jgi:hypothetical protein
MSEEQPDYLDNPLMPKCPIFTHDLALLWIDAAQGNISYNAHLCDVKAHGVTGSWKVGFGGFDARGALLMATRDVWHRIHANEAKRGGEA